VAKISKKCTVMEEMRTIKRTFTVKNILTIMEASKPCRKVRGFI
jgi:hypothetical protein